MGARRAFAISLAAVLAAGAAHAQQIPHTPGQIPPYVDPNNPPFQLPPGPGDPLDRLYPGPLRPDPVPDKQTPVQSPLQRNEAPVPGALAPGAPVPGAMRPRSVPQGFTMTIERAGRQMVSGALSRPRQIGEHLAACWTPPAPGSEVTVRVTFNRRGAVIGTPRVTYVKPGRGADRAAVTRSAERAFARCLPLRFTAELGSAIAGRPFAFRLIASGAAHR